MTDPRPTTGPPHDGDDVPRRLGAGPGTGPRTHVRELLGSALVGIAARRRVDPGHVGRIRVTSAHGGGPLVVRDDGVGFTAQEVRWLAATPDTQEHGPIREGLRRYEVALLACFHVADVVELRTRSALVPGAPTMRWVGLADGTVRVTLAEEPLDEPGTEIRLHPRTRTRSWCTPETTLEHVLDVADQLPVAVEVDGVEVSGRATVWDRDADDQAEWCRQRLGVDPLVVLPLTSAVSGIRAVAVVLPWATRPGHRTASRRYVRGMLAAEGAEALVPSWSGFCHLVVDDARDILTDPAHDDDAVAELLGRALLFQLLLLHAERPALFDRVVELHGEALVRRALDSSDVLTLVRAMVPLPTTLGARSLDALGADGDVVLYTDDPVLWAAVRQDATRDGVLVVDATEPAVAAFLDRVEGPGPRFVRLRDTDRLVLDAAS